MSEAPGPNHQERVELLAPAGSFEALVAAVENGADAVYLGGQAFNARKFASNFDDGELQRAIDLAHVRGVKVFITLNTLLFDRELPEAVAFLRKVRRMGADAVIVQDLGLMRAVRELTPDLPLHISTQATVHNADGIRFLEDLGAERVILARENSLKEMQAMHESTGAELEQFVHGAMCYCYSGQCLMSSLIGGRSGNRGACAYTCRLPYSMEEGAAGSHGTTGTTGTTETTEPAAMREPGGGGVNVTLLDEGDAADIEWTYTPPKGTKLPGNPTPGFLGGPVAYETMPEVREKHVLSARDMKTLEHVPELIEAGVTSFKIEGRMKRPEYVAIVTRAYRNAIDRTYEGNFHITDEEREAVTRVFNRDFNHSWLHGKEKWAFTNWDTAGNQGVPLGTVVASGKGWVKVRLDDTLRVKDGIEIVHRPEGWHGQGGSAPEDYGFRVHRILLPGGKYTSEAHAGEVVELHGRQWSSPGDPVYKTADTEVLERARATYEDGPHRKVPVTGEAHIVPGEPLVVRLEDVATGLAIEHTSDYEVQPARKAPMTYEHAVEQLDRFVDTPFEPVGFEVVLGENAFVPLSVLNEARRTAVAALEEALAEAHHREPLPDEDERAARFLAGHAAERTHGETLELAVNCWGLPNVRAALEAGAKTVYFSGLRVGGLQPKWDEEALGRALDAADEHGARLYIASGMVQKDSEIAQLRRVVQRFKDRLAGVLAGNHGAFQVALQEGVPVITDWPLNVYNGATCEYLTDHARAASGTPVDAVTVSPEITLEDIEGLARHTGARLEAIAHGRHTLMTSEYCSIGHATKCQLPGGTWAPCHDRKYKLKDRTGAHFPLETDGACRMYILNAVELNMIDKLDELAAAGVDRVRIETIGTDPEATRVQVEAYLGAIADHHAGRAFDKARWDALARACPDGFTTGHFYRGPL